MAGKTANTARPKHVPQRTCVACRQESAKRELVRIVRTPAGIVQIDPTGKASGRGAYLCRRRACWDMAAKKRILEHVLQTTVGPVEKVTLEQFAAGLTS
ncbi:MAG: YlxR family protein [Chloroflexi bacterium]|nr:YlxR family protein [Chloroflexota bacterium]